MLAEKIINHILLLNPQSSLYLKELNQKCLQVRVKKILFWKVFYVVFSTEGITLSTSEQTSHATVKGSIKAFLHFALTKDPRQATQLGLTFEGDNVLLETVQQLFWSLDIDWEEVLSHYIGDVPANQMGTVLQMIQKKKRKVTDNFVGNVSEYLKEEVLLFPPRAVMNDFIDGVEQLRTDVERLEAKINQRILDQ